MAREPMWTIYTASRHFGIHPKRLRRILASRNLLDADHHSRSDNQVAFEAPDIESYLQSLSECMSQVKARAYLNMPRPHDQLLLDAGILTPFIVGGIDSLKDHGFRKSDLDAFLERMRFHAKPLDAVDLTSIPGASKRADCSAVEVVTLLLDGRLKRVALDPCHTGYLSILVDPEEIRPLVRLADHGCLTLREVEKRARWDTSVVKGLVDHGLLKSESAINPVKRQRQTVVRPEELTRFNEAFVSLQGLAAEAGIHFLKLKQLLEAAAVSPALGFEAVPATFYHRAQAEAALTARQPQI